MLEKSLDSQENTAPAQLLILLVEDDRQLVQIEQYILEAEGYRVALAGSGEEALELLRESPPDLVLLDIGLPGMDGFATCQCIREVSQAPVIMVTGSAAGDDKRRAMAAGASDFMPKPFSPGKLIGRVKAALQHSSRAPRK